MRKWFDRIINIVLGLAFIAWAGQGLWVALYIRYLIYIKEG